MKKTLIIFGLCLAIFTALFVITEINDEKEFRQQLSQIDQFIAEYER